MLKMKAAYMTAMQKIEISDMEMDAPQADEVTVKLEYCGVCGSDVHFFEHGCIGNTKVPYPFILGHESAGIVTALGKEVKNLKAGDRVALEPGVPCGKCEFCRQGRYNLCREVKFLAAPPTNGAFREYINHPAFMAYRLPENVGTLEGALIEPLAVGLQAVENARFKPGKTALILGSGAIGLVSMMACKAAGARMVVVSDLFERRLEKAKALGADHVFHAGKDVDFMDMCGFTDGEGFDYVFETAGSKATAAQTGYLVRRGGNIVMVGNIVGDVAFNFRNLYLKEADVKTVFRYRNQYPVAIQRIASGMIPVKEIVSDIFDFEDVGKALEKAAFHKEDVIKAVVKFK